jgi:predicted nucleic acid-binding protein
VGLTEALGAGPIAVDTALFIYFIEEHPNFLAPVRELFARADAGEFELVTSALTLLEVLVVPLRSGVRTLAALQLAAAIGANCTSFITNDRRIPAPDGVRVLQLSACE